MNNSIFHRECLRFYEDSMQMEMEKASPYFTETKIQKIHQKLKDVTINKVKFNVWRWNFDHSSYCY